MYLKRKIDKYLLDWKNNPNKKPLIIKGARQIGKTESILKFANDNYNNVIYINFIEEPIYKGITEAGYSVDEIIKNISRIDPNKKFSNFKDTIIIFDEIQDFIDISTSLKFFKIDGRFDVICSGSMLGINYNKISSVSTGYKTDCEMNSLDFEEFLWAKGYSETVRDEFLNKMLNQNAFSELELKIYFDLFLDFSILGGMPEIVKSYIQNKTFEGTLENQKQIVEDYRQDIHKYAEGVDKTRLINLYNHIPVQLAQENKKFQFSKLNKNARYREYQGTVEWLEAAGMINVCYNLNSLSLPIKGNYKPNEFKIYLKDSGLLVSQLDDESQMDLRVNKNLGVYKGALYENIVAEAFIKSGLELYYYNNTKKQIELDFVLRSKDNIVPIEVKASTGTIKSINKVIDDNLYNEINYGIKLARKNIGFNGKVYTFPYFLAFILKDYLKIKK